MTWRPITIEPNDQTFVGQRLSYEGMEGTGDQEDKKRMSAILVWVGSQHMAIVNDWNHESVWPLDTRNWEVWEEPNQIQSLDSLKLEKGKRYLVQTKWPLTAELLEIIVLEISKTAYKLKYVGGGESWNEKKEMDRDYEILEVL